MNTEQSEGFETHFCPDTARGEEVFRPRGGNFRYEYDEGYQLVKFVLQSADGTDRTICVMDPAEAYRFASNLSVATVSSHCRESEADAIEATEMQDNQDAA